MVHKTYPSAEVDKYQLCLIEKMDDFLNKVSFQITSSKNLVSLLKRFAHYCKELDTLTIRRFPGLPIQESFVRDIEKSLQVYSVEMLVLDNCCFLQEQLLYLANVLPRLKTVTLKNFLTHRSFIAEKPSLISICLPNLSIDCLNIEMGMSFTSNKKVAHYIKLAIDVEKESRHCSFTVKLADSAIAGYSVIDGPTESAFRESIFNQNISTYLIYCRSIKTFMFKYTDFKMVAIKLLICLLNL